MKQETEQEILKQVSIIEAREGLKLVKYSKGFGWEIRILDLDIDKLEKLNNEMKERFGD